MAREASEFRFDDLSVGDAGWLIEQHALLYTRDEGFDASFEALVARVLADFIDHSQFPRDRAWIARQGDERLGSIFCVAGPAPHQAKLRLFLVLPQARGTGLGRQLLEQCITHARDQGYRELTLWTHESHRAACALYRARGFTCTASRPVRSFGVDLVEQEWVLDLSA